MYVLTGWLLASAQLDSARPPSGRLGACRLGTSRTFPAEQEILERMPAGALDSSEVEPDRMSPRELRRLPAIGPTRALAIAKARWERGLTGGPEAWEDVPGIGPETVRSIRGAMDRWRIERKP
jgi:hypothetical protein